jgi:hypothetical protein
MKLLRPNQFTQRMGDTSSDRRPHPRMNVYIILGGSSGRTSQVCSLTSKGDEAGPRQDASTFAYQIMLRMKVKLDEDYMEGCMEASDLPSLKSLVSLLSL